MFRLATFVWRCTHFKRKRIAWCGEKKRAACSIPNTLAQLERIFNGCEDLERILEDLLVERS
jgi:hypothetical protein